MRILWLVNRVLPIFYRQLGLSETNFGGGWLTGLSNSLSNSDDIELAICAPMNSIGEIKKGAEKNIRYYFFPEKDVRCYLPETLPYLRDIVSDFAPDVIHIFGTEYPRTLEMINAVGSEKILISLTGILTKCFDAYTAALPQKVCRRHAFRRKIAGINNRLFFLESRLISYGRDDFASRSVYERKALEKARYVSGRTKFDHDAAMSINPELCYLFCNESLRDSFYSAEKWEYAKCRPHSIFISNAGYPLKGFHQVLEACKLLKEKYPDISIHVAGNSPFAKKGGIKDWLIRATDEYGQYLTQLIKKCGLMEAVVFLGNLNEEQMIEQYLFSNTFVLPSSTENSPNSLGEAMLLGTPCIASEVGGVAEMMINGREGITYPFEDTKALAEAISFVFDHPAESAEYGKAAILHAEKTHCVQHNNETMIEIYRKISGQES